MPYGLYMSAQGAQVQSQRLESISHNLANADTVGFKRQLAIAQARHSEAIEQSMDYPGSRSINDLGGGVMVRETYTDFTSGPLQNTGVKTDVAIEGEGFFMVEKTDGERRLTRAGNFMFDSNGQLTTQQGYKVLNSTGSPIQVDPSVGPVNISRDGQIFQQQGSQIIQIGDIGVVTIAPESRARMLREGENLFKTSDSVTQLPAPDRKIHVGHLEQSSVRPTTEMMKMIEASRAFEANVNMIRNQDQMTGTLISRVLRQS